MTTNQKDERELRIEGAILNFKKLLNTYSSLNEIKHKLYELHFDCSQYVIAYPDEHRYNCHTNLHYLMEIIEVLQTDDLEINNSITESQALQLNNIFNPVEIENPELIILEVSGKRTSQVEELNFFEAKVLLDRFYKTNKLFELTIKPARTA